MTKFEINTELKIIDKILNFFAKEDNKIIGYCGHCGTPVFNDKAPWFKIGLCVFCYDLQKDDK